MRLECKNCQKTSKMICKCEKASYCDKECQKKDFVKHKLICTEKILTIRLVEVKKSNIFSKTDFNFLLQIFMNARFKVGDEKIVSQSTLPHSIKSNLSNDLRNALSDPEVKVVWFGCEKDLFLSNFLS